MSTISDLVFGDKVSIGASKVYGTFIGRSDHPRYDGFQAVVWLMSDGRWSVDALSPRQEVDVFERAPFDEIVDLLPPVLGEVQRGEQ